MTCYTKSFTELDEIIQKMADEWHGADRPSRINFVLGCWDQANGFFTSGKKSPGYYEGIAAAKKKGL